MSGTNHPVTRHHIPQERRPELHHYKSLKPHTSMCDLCEARLWTLLNDFIMQPIMLHRLECVEILSEHVSTCTGCDLNTTSVVSKLWQKYEECVHISQQKMSNQNLEQWININFCVKVRETCNVSEEYVWDRNYEEIRCFWVTQFTGGWEKMEDTERSSHPKIHNLIKRLKQCRIMFVHIMPNSQSCLLCSNIDDITHSLELWPNNY